MTGVTCDNVVEFIPSSTGTPSGPGPNGRSGGGGPDGDGDGRNNKVYSNTRFGRAQKQYDSRVSAAEKKWGKSRCDADLAAEARATCNKDGHDNGKPAKPGEPLTATQVGNGILATPACSRKMVAFALGTGGFGCTDPDDFADGPSYGHKKTPLPRKTQNKVRACIAQARAYVTNNSEQACEDTITHDKWGGGACVPMLGEALDACQSQQDQAKNECYKHPGQ